VWCVGGAFCGVSKIRSPHDGRLSGMAVSSFFVARFSVWGCLVMWGVLVVCVGCSIVVTFWGYALGLALV
jgi:hypothetical protein